jgi:hypothetical protein
MSRASTYPHHTDNWQQASLPLDRAWTASSDFGISDYQYSLSSHTVGPFMIADPASLFETVLFFDTRAGAIIDAFLTTLQFLSQSSKYLTYTASIDPNISERIQKDDLWIDMPAHSSKKVVMKAKYTGRGKPRAILEPLSEG